MDNNKNSGNEKPKYDPENDPTIGEVLNEEFGKDNFIVDDDLLKSRNDSDEDCLDDFFDDSEEQNNLEKFCPICGSDLVLRTRKSDGKRFWGCSGFYKFRCKYKKIFE